VVSRPRLRDQVAGLACAAGGWLERGVGVFHGVGHPVEHLDPTAITALSPG
jgi:uncharacterized membrane protein YhiD involved in acid resistance